MSDRVGCRHAPVCALILILASAAVPPIAWAQTGAATPATAVPADSVTSPAAVPADPMAPAAPADSMAPAPTPAPAVAPAATVAPASAAAAPPATAPAPAAQTQKSSGSPFDRGKLRLSFTGGWGRSFTDSYLLLGVGLGYYLKEGLDVGADFEGWLLNDPTIYKLTPGFRYVLTRSPVAKPFFGGFYRRTFVDGQDDLDSAGGRVGAYRMGRGSMVGVGAVYEYYFDCDKAVYEDCSTVYPEFVLSKSF